MKRASHHALLYISPNAALPEDLQGYAHTNNPDYRVHHYTVLGIADARSIIADSQTRPIGEEKVYVLCVEKATLEAQNALLKLLEEPPLKTQFHIVVPHRDVLIDTVCSRLLLQSTGSDAVVDENEISFCSKNLSKRLEYIAVLVKEKNIYALNAILRECEVETVRNRDSKGMRAVKKVYLYKDAPGASQKMLFEYLALLV